MPLVPEMHATPTITISGSLPVFDGNGTSTVNAISNNFSRKDKIEVDMTGSAGLVSTRPAVIYDDAGSGYLLVDADI